MILTQIQEPVDYEKEAAKQLLGSFLIDPELVSKYRSSVSPQDMPTPELRVVLERIYGWQESEGPLPVAVAKALRGHKLFQGDYPAGYAVAELGTSVSTTAHATYYAKETLKASRTRRLRGILADAHHDAQHGKEFSEVFANLDSGLERLRVHAGQGIEGSEDIFEEYCEGVLSREKPSLYFIAPAGSSLNGVPVGEGIVTMFGAPPGEGKTALVSQGVIDAMRLQSQVRVLFANVEMSPQAILNRQLARLSGIGHSYIHHRDYDSSATPRVEAALDELRRVMPRLRFMRPPFTLERLQLETEDFQPQIVVVDYAQRFTSAVDSDMRSQTNATMDTCRRIAEQGRAVIVVSAMSRQKGKSGSTYASDAMGLASFRESSELEYGCDSAWILSRKEPGAEEVELRCVKNRHGSMDSIPLKFDGARQRFSANTKCTEWHP